MGQHLEYMRNLAGGGSLVIGGPFLVGVGGMALFQVKDRPTAQSLADGDPAARAGVLSYDLKPMLAVVDQMSDEPVLKSVGAVVSELGTCSARVDG